MIVLNVFRTSKNYTKKSGSVLDLELLNEILSLNEFIELNLRIFERILMNHK